MKNLSSFALAFALAALGVSLVALALSLAYPSSVEVRLIGLCDGRILAAMEEDEFPHGCDWIEPIRYEE